MQNNEEKNPFKLTEELHCHSRRKQAHKFYNRQGYAESPKYLIKMLR